MSLVELHYLPLDQHGFDIDLEKALDFLDETEKSRYHRFKNESAKSCFLQARRIAKTQLAEKLQCAPAEIVFDYSDNEKPFLSAEKYSQTCHFNISHSKTAIVVAISEAPVGVDVEDIARCLKIWPRAESFLNGYVKTCVEKGKSDQERAAIFAEHWACTESFIKLKGSAIYLEVKRVQAQAHSNFENGRRKTFEDSCFTVLNLSTSACISVAAEKEFPNIEVLHWRTGERTRLS